MNASTIPWLSDAEVDDLCAGLTQNAARVKFLRSQGLTVTTKPNGRPLVMRDHAERVLSGIPPAPTGAGAHAAPGMAKPNRAALVLAFQKQAA